jgi:hypothetical protein
VGWGVIDISSVLVITIVARFPTAIVKEMWGWLQASAITLANSNFNPDRIGGRCLWCSLLFSSTQQTPCKCTSPPNAHILHVQIHVRLRLHRKCVQFSPSAAWNDGVTSKPAIVASVCYCRQDVGIVWGIAWLCGDILMKQSRTYLCHCLVDEWQRLDCWHGRTLALLINCQGNPSCTAATTRPSECSAFQAAE